MSKITINYSPLIEAEVISDTLKNYDWLKQNFYRVYLPKAIEKNLKVSNQEIKKIAADYFQEKRFNYLKKKILAWWQRNELKISNYFEKHQIKFLKDYSVYLTNYGVGGSYFLPKKIVINISGKNLFYLYITIVHEFIHLGIEDLIKKHKIPHFVKERIVDLVMAEMYPRSYKKQNLPVTIPIEKIDKLWKEGKKSVPVLIKNLTQSS